MDAPFAWIDRSKFKLSAVYFRSRKMCVTGGKKVEKLQIRPINLRILSKEEHPTNVSIKITF